MHNNPVEEGLVYKPQEYVYSSAGGYADQKGLIDGVMTFRCLMVK